MWKGLYRGLSQNLQNRVENKTSSLQSSLKLSKTDENTNKSIIYYIIQSFSVRSVSETVMPLTLLPIRYKPINGHTSLHSPVKLACVSSSHRILDFCLLLGQSLLSYKPKWLGTWSHIVQHNSNTRVYHLHSLIL